jgi:hypothetical protein
MSQPLFLWDPFAICEGPREKDRICCGLTKRGTPCKLYITEDVHNAGVKKLHTLACQPFHLPTFQHKLHDIVPHFLCARWHRRLQVDDVRKQWEAAAIRNQAQAQTPRHRSATTASGQVLCPEGRGRGERTELNTPRASGSPDSLQSTRTTEPGESSHAFCPKVTETTLRENRVPWDVSRARPATLSIQKESGEEVFLHLQSFSPTSSLRHERCGFCHGEDPDEPVVLKCGRCTTYVHLNCMSLWLRTRESGSRPSCVTWYVNCGFSIWRFH